VTWSSLTYDHANCASVESFIPYSNYRGAVVDDQGKIWLGLDTSIKPQGYTRTQGAGVPADILSTLRDDYLKAAQSLSPVDYLKGKLNDSLATTQPPKTWSDLKDSATIIPNILKIIPSTLQFPQIAITGEYQTLPDELKHKLTFSATAGSTELFSLTLETHKLSNKRLALRAEPETVEDQNTIDSFGGLDNTPPYLVRLRPVLTVDGERMIVAQDGLPMGGDYTLNIDVITPNGTERITSGQINGNLSVIGVVAQKAQTPAAIAEGDNAEAILHKEAIGYIDRWNRSEDDLAALLGQHVSRPTVTIATVGAQLEVTQLLDTPHDMQWKGLFLDAGYRRIESVGRNGNERDFMRLSALQGSILENRIFEDDLKVDSVSTAKLLQLAKASTASIINIDKSNVDAILPTLPFDDAVTSDITNAVNQGLTVTIPQNEVAYQNWTGIGYIKEDLTTGESGWMLSGNVAGGMTAWLPESWDTATLKAISTALRTPYSGAPNTHPDQATRIFKIPVRDQQIGVVGKALKYALQVKVTDQTGRQVQGAPVTFTIKAGGGTFDDNTAIKTEPTDALGIAQVVLILGQQTSVNPSYWFTDGNTYSDQYGVNIVNAALANGLAIASPFSEYAAPGALANLRPTSGVNLSGVILSYAGFVGLMAEDSYKNPIANQKVAFEIGDPTVGGICKGKEYDHTLGLLIRSGDACINSSPTINDTLTSCTKPGKNIDGVTSTTGAWVGVVLGGAPGATYPITATTSANGKSFSTQFTPKSYDFTTCNSNAPPKADLFISSLMDSDIYGHIINAGRSGSDISIMAKEYLVTEGLKTAPETLSCDGTTLSCSKIVGDHTFTTTSTFYGDGATALFNGTPVKNLGNGIFQGIYTLKPGLNTVKIEGLASYTFNSMNNSCSACATAPTSTVRTLTANPTSIQVYGVDIAIKQPLNIMLDGLGASRNNLRISYSINPSDYQAANAIIMLYKVTETNSQKNYEQIDYIPVETKGSGYGTLARGYQFDESLSYAVKVVLNYGSTAQIMSDPVPITIVKGVLIPDYNHNRKIDDEDLDRALNNDPYYFWVNDDDGTGDTEGSGIPGSKDNTTNLTIPGTRNLVNWFPVYLDIKLVVDMYSPSSYRYALTSTSGQLKFVYSKLTSTTSGTYLTDVPTAQGMAVGAGPKINGIANFGGLANPLDSGFIESIRTSGNGVILVEGVGKSATPLVLAVYDQDNKVVFSASLNLSIDGVEQMFRHKNLMKEMYQIEQQFPGIIPPGGVLPVAGHPVPNEGMLDRLVPSDFSNQSHFSGFDADSVNSDNETGKTNDFIHVHGYNVNGQDARGEHAEVFKRLYWSGSKSRFWGITWYGYDSQKDMTKFCMGIRSPNYHVNVRHAFNTGILLRNFVNNNNISNVTIFAHSLGNMVVSTAIKKGMQYGRYLMVNAAVAEEDYVPQSAYESENDWMNNTRPMMYDAGWRHPYLLDVSLNDAYQPFLWASEWYKHFVDNQDDGRSKLTWRGYFQKVQEGGKVYAFFTPTDQAFRPFEYSLADVDSKPDLQNYPDPPNHSYGFWDFLMKNWMPGCLSDLDKIGTYSWSIQELTKGQVPASVVDESNHGGWGFNDSNYGASYCQNYYGGDVVDICTPFSRITPPQANALKTKIKDPNFKNLLKIEPLFDKNPDNALLFTDQNVTLTEVKQVELLANEIPALTFATGHRGTGSFPDKFNIDIRNKYLKTVPNAPWPRGDDYEWRHSDLIKVAYPYVYGLYFDWVKLMIGETIQ
jgi:hypothetical protein